MSLNRVFVAIAGVVVLAGCPNPPPPPSPEPGPFLSDTPLWTMEAPESLRQSCFGSSIALGDVNGDGMQDLVVAAPPCTDMRGKGHLAIYAGDGSSFPNEPVIAELDWQHPNPSAIGRNSAVSIGNVNGDRFADILIRSQFTGTLVFAGKEDLGAVLQAPLFRVPYAGTQYASFLSDVNGDGLDDLVIAQGAMRTTSIFRATPAAEAPFTVVRVIQDAAVRVLRAGDINRDGAGDVLIVTSQGSRLFLGCKQDEAGICEGGLASSPVWTATEAVQGFFPDQNGDGYPEIILGGAARVQVHLYQPEGGLSSAPIWSVLGDPAYPGFSTATVSPGDLNKDGQETEFLMGAVGRLYAFFPEQGLSAELRPGWAWPKSNAVGPAFQGFVRYAAVRAGDLNGDGYADLITGLAPPSDLLTPGVTPWPGRVVAFGGGKVPPETPTPILKDAVSCGLTGGEGKPDVTVDGEVISRTVYLDRRNFSETACEVTERCVGAPGDRRLLRFSVSIPNLGTGPVHIASPEERPDLYAFDECHQHDHLIGFASYELLDAQGSAVSVGRKQGFFLVDAAPYCGDAANPFVNLDGSQGISPGWADVYVADYPCQWLDVTDVPDGTYTLRVGVDKADIVDEQDVHPNSVDVTVRLSGNAVEVLP